MPKNGISVIGLDEVQEVLRAIAPRQARNLMRATIHGIAAEIAKDARSLAPVDTGALKKAIKARRVKSHPDRPVSEVYVQTGKGKTPDAYYWRFVEYGTGGDNPRQEHPFIRPARDKARANMPDVISRQFGKKLESALKRASKAK